ncbi:MAG: hypothetical protein MR698_02230 [Selenomonas sp.]|nr:hypothetical protein [Selenomonas sp.]
MKISHNVITSQASQTFSKKSYPLTSTASQDSKAPWLSKAAEVYISQNGKELSAASRLRADQETGAESSLREIKADKAQTASDKKRIAEIDETLSAEDGRLTDSDREALQKERAELEQRSKTPEDRLHETYQKIRTLEKEQDSGTLTEGDTCIIADQISALESSIRKQQEAIQKQGKKEEALSQQAVQERVAQDGKTSRILAKQSERQQEHHASQSGLLQQAAETAAARAKEKDA